MPNYDFRQRFRSVGDASMRHSRTYVAVIDDEGLYHPYYVNEVSGSTSDPTLHLVNRDGSNQREIRMSDSRLVTERPEIGMVNVQCRRTRKTFALWSEALASRQIKRSLDFNLIRAEPVGRGIAESHFRFDVSLRHGDNKEKALDSYYNARFPKYTECLEGVARGRHYSMAFSRRFALGAHPRCGVALYYKNIIVGYVPDCIPVLLPQFEYLAEQLEESANAYE